MRVALTGDEEHQLLLALMPEGRPPVPEDVLEAEFAHVTEWALRTRVSMGILENVLAGRTTVAVIEGELMFK